MKATFETEDLQEILLFANSSKMASFIWQLVHNGYREFKSTDYDYQPAWDKINELLDEYDIDIDSIIG